VTAGSALGAIDAGCRAFLGAPFPGQPSDISELNDPGDRVGGYYELVVENRFFVHTFPPAGAGW
jgi:hypothetical protein